MSWSDPTQDSAPRRSRAWLRSILNLLLGVGVAGGIAFWLLSDTGRPPDSAAVPEATRSAAGGPDAGADRAAAPSIPEVAVLYSRSRELVYDFPLRGFTEAARRVDVRAQTAGLVVGDRVAKGSRVQTGDLLCRLEAGDRPALLRQARARLDKETADARTARQLASDGFGSTSAAAAAETARAAAQAEVERIELDIGRTEIRAPFAGALETDSAETGSLLQPGSLCAAILGLDPIRVVGFAPERAIEIFVEGREAAAVFADGRRAAGVISFVSRTADPNTRTFRVELTLANADYAIRDGLSAEILMPVRRQAAHLVPQSALTLNDDGEVGLRLVNADNSTQFAAVRLLRDTPEGFWVDQLPPEVDVIVVGQEFVADGVQVRPRPVEEVLPP